MSGEYLSEVDRKLEEKVKKIKEKRGEVFSFRPSITVCGVRSVGKSTLLGLLVKNPEIFQHSLGETTRDVAHLYLDQNSKPIIQDSLGNVKIVKQVDRELLEFIEIVDLPGLDGDYEKVTLDYFKNNDVDIVIYIIDISKGLKNKDEKFLKMLKNKNTYVLFVLNKIDMIADEDIDHTLDYLGKIINDTFNVFPRSKTLGFITFSCKKFSNNEIASRVLKNIIIVTSYIRNLNKNLEYIGEIFLKEEEGLLRNNILDEQHLRYISKQIRKKAKRFIRKLGTDTLFYQQSIREALDVLSQQVSIELGNFLNMNINNFFLNRNEKLNEVVNTLLAGLEELPAYKHPDLDVNFTIGNDVIEELSKYGAEENYFSLILGIFFLGLIGFIIFNFPAPCLK